MRKAFIILWKDVLTELRAKEIISSVLVFALLVVISLSFAFEPERMAPIISGVLWIAFSFAGVLGLSRSFILEKDKGCLEGLMSCPVAREVIYLGKMLSSLGFMLAVAVVILPVFAVLFNLPIFMPGLISVVFLAFLGFCSVGTLFSALSVNTKAREVMLPILFFPVVSPLIISAVKATELVLAGKGWGNLLSWLQVMAAFDITFLVASSLLFEFVVEE